MQDKDPTYNEFDATFEDKAWERMQELLDEEMPVRSPFYQWIRRYGLLVFLFIFGLSLGLGGSYMLKNKKQDDVPAIVNKAPIAAVELSNASEKHESLEKSHTELEGSASASQNSSDKNPENKKEAAVAQKNKADNKMVFTSKASKLSQITNNLNSPQLETRNSKLPTPNSQLPTHNSKLTTRNSKLETQNSELLNKLGTLPFSQLEYEEEQPNAKDYAFSEEYKRPFPVRLSLQAGINSNAPGSINGWSAGILADVSVINSKVNLQSGIRLLTFNAEKNSFFESLSKSDSDDFALDPNTESNLGGIGSNFLPADSYYDLDQTFYFRSNSYALVQNSAQLENRTYLQVPITLSYRFGNRWKAHAGISMAYLLSGEKMRTYQYIGNLDTGSNAIPELVTANARKFDFGGMGGVAYDISKRFSLNLDYQFGLFAHYPDVNKKSFNRFFQLSMVYHLN
ncbi:MAG: PorT family protein [Bacteroidetes bacterium]|nr:PorT family protein [Bacteroidota bacterium]